MVFKRWKLVPWYCWGQGSIDVVGRLTENGCRCSNFISLQHHGYLKKGYRVVYMKIVFLLLGLYFANSIFAQTSDKRVYINPSAGIYRLTTDPNNINNIPFMFDGKIGTDIGKHGIIGLQFTRIHQSGKVSGSYSEQPVSGPFSLTRYGELTHQITALGVFYERLFSIGKYIDIFPSAYIQYLDFKEVESGDLMFGPYPYGTYKRQALNKYSARAGLNLNMQYNLGKSWSITLRFAQFDCRIWDSSRKNISGELPFLVGIKFAY